MAEDTIDVTLADLAPQLDHLNHAYVYDRPPQSWFACTDPANLSVVGTRWVTLPWSSCDSSACSLCPAAILQSQSCRKDSAVSPAGLLSHVLDTLLNPSITRGKPSTREAADGGDVLITLSDAFRTHYIQHLGTDGASSAVQQASCDGSSNASANTEVDTGTVAAATAVQCADLPIADGAKLTSTPQSKGRSTRRRYSLDEEARDALQVKRKSCLSGQALTKIEVIREAPTPSSSSSSPTSVPTSPLDAGALLTALATITQSPPSDPAGFCGRQSSVLFRSFPPTCSAIPPPADRPRSAQDGCGVRTSSDLFRSASCTFPEGAPREGPQPPAPCEGPLATCPMAPDEASSSSITQAESLPSPLPASPQLQHVSRASLDGISSGRATRSGCQGWITRWPWRESWGSPTLTLESFAGPGPSDPVQPSNAGALGEDATLALEFSPDGLYLGSITVRRKIHVYHMGPCESPGNGPSMMVPAFSHAVPFSRLDCLAWNPWEQGVVTVGGGRGSLMHLHVPTGHWISEFDSNTADRVWSVAYSGLRRNLLAVTGQQGRVRLLAGVYMDTVAASFSLPSEHSVTGVDFCPDDENGIAVSCSDNRAYVFDLRHLTNPVHVLEGHTAPVSYVKYMYRNLLITSSTDSSIASWNLLHAQPSNAGVGGTVRPLEQFKGHSNTKFFVGLSVLPEESLVACGSETTAAYVYHMSQPAPLTRKDVSELPQREGPSRVSAEEDLLDGCRRLSLDSCERESLPRRRGWVRSVCWQPQTPYLVGSGTPGPLLATSLTDGLVRLYRFHPPPRSSSDGC